MCRDAACRVSTTPLKPDRRTNGNPQIVIHAAIEIHFVAGVGTKTDRTQEELKTSAREEHAIQIGILKLRRKIAEGHGTGRNPKAHEPTLGKQESANCGLGAELELRTEHGMRGAQSGREHRGV